MEAVLKQMKMEIAEELGLIEKVKKVGWGGLSAAETGKVGGLMNQRLKHISNGHPQRDQFTEGKIGSGYMSTIEGQPHLEDFVEKT